MSKELEALKRMTSDNGYDYSVDNFWEDYKIVETALKRLEEIDKVMFLNNKQLKALESIKKKPDTLSLVKTCENYNAYFELAQDVALIEDIYSPEEFDLLKEVLL